MKTFFKLMRTMIAALLIIPWLIASTVVYFATDKDRRVIEVTNKLFTNILGKED